MVVREGVVSPSGGVGTFDVQNSAGTSILFVTGSGRVGIGTIAPQAAFHVVNGTVPNTANLYVGYAGSNNYFDANTQYFRDGSGNTRLTINSTGNVTPGSDNTQNLGSAALRWANIYAANMSGSLTSSNVSSGQVVVAGTGGVLSGSNNFWWNNSTQSVGIGTSSPGFTLEVFGDFAASTKSFVIPHPLKPGWKLRYGSLEGPENGVYVRGRSESEVIELPDYWEPLVDSDSITVQITPVGKWQSLHVEGVENNRVKIGRGWFMRLFRIKPRFFYTVTAARRDFTFKVEYDPTEG